MVGSALNCPARHAVQLDAPTACSVFVTEPGPHSAHGTAGFALYCPTAHIVQVILSVVEPGAHAVHATVESLPCLPGEQALHSLLPGLANVLVVEPAEHVEQLAPLGLCRYFPGGHNAHGVVEFGLNWPLGQAVQFSALSPASVFVTEPGLHAWQFGGASVHFQL